MKASEVLKRYQAGERNFQRVNLRGQSFKGQNLSGANFSEADIRSTNFIGANLKGANFTGAKCGLQRRWALVLVVSSFFLSAFSGFLATWGGSATAKTLSEQFSQELGYTSGPGLLGIAIFLALVALFVFIVEKKIITYFVISSSILSLAGIFLFIITATVGTLSGNVGMGKIFETYAFVIFGTMIVVFLGAGSHALSLGMVNAKDRIPIESWIGFLLLVIVNYSTKKEVMGELFSGTNNFDFLVSVCLPIVYYRETRIGYWD